MQFDDRLATVLRQRVTGNRAARTQYRQLLDLLGQRKPVRGRQLAAEAWRRMNALAETIPVGERAEIVDESGWHLTSPELVAHLANDEPPVAAAALARAHLCAEDWEALIPRLPIRARGFLRFRSDLPARTVGLLDSLGVHDRGLPEPDSVKSERAGAQPLETTVEPVTASPTDQPDELAAEDSEIGRLVKRIEAFQRARSGEDNRPGSAADPRLPLGDTGETPGRAHIAAFDFTSDAHGRIDWASEAAAAMVFGASLAGLNGEPPRALQDRQPLSGIPIELGGAAAVAGEWRVDAAPIFGTTSGEFTGYAGRFRRSVIVRSAAEGETPASDSNAQSDRIRQMLHELRTPVNAIQGFAELIQQQMFGPVPHEYRAHAATIAGDAARILAGFDELDRLARLESGALEIEPGSSDFAGIVRALVGQLQGVLATRMASFDAEFSQGPCLVALDRSDADAIAWRLLATIAATVSPGEEIELRLACDPDMMRLRIHLTATLMGQDDIYRSTARSGGSALSSGAFGTGFALRLARAEARAAGGDLCEEDDDWLVLSLPHLTAADAGPSERTRHQP
ncbi:MAG: histidine kinase dimerization/phospho-acceptor domain-containing protein [Alteripontixanthobacter sp.]